ncbi:DNA adenine methylase [Tautonia plasticadhaerens]|uniref:DNA adenine methylase n=1 Tax=Tautonia plasticadhaerens TaxID=2527974 RepID=UPI0018D232DC|nr:DNA adenine methylase [Tautonia plasticadhaerens]
MPLKHYGGKAPLAPWIVGLLPEGRSYAELFAGGASVLFNRPKAGREWLNDLDPEVMRFFEQLQDPGSFQVIRRVADEACSELSHLWAPLDLDDDNTRVKETYRHLKERYKAEQDPSVAAGLFFVLKKIGRNGDTSSVVTSSRYRRSMPESLSALLSACEELPAFHARLKGVHLSQRDALGLIDEIDEEGVVLYLDPPYLHATRRTVHNYGIREMSEPDHEALLRRLLRCRCSVAISGYPSDLYDGCLTGAPGWVRHEKEVRCSSSNHCKDTRRTEVLWVKR